MFSRIAALYYAKGFRLRTHPLYRTAVENVPLSWASTMLTLVPTMYYSPRRRRQMDTGYALIELELERLDRIGFVQRPFDFQTEPPWIQNPGLGVADRTRGPETIEESDEREQLEDGLREVYGMWAWRLKDDPDFLEASGGGIFPSWQGDVDASTRRLSRRLEFEADFARTADKIAAIRRRDAEANKCSDPSATNPSIARGGPPT